MEQKTLFDRLGGASVLDQALLKMEESMKNDPMMAESHKGVDMAKSRESGKSYLMQLFGGPAEYKGRSMAESHKHLNLNDAHFNLFVFYFKKALADVNVSQQLIEEAELALAPTRQEVINCDSLYNRIGGEATLSKFSDLFTEKLLADPVLGPIYGQFDLKKIQAIRQKYLTLLFGGKTEYNGRTMREAHAKHNLDDSHFDRFILVTKDCFTQMNLKEDLLKEVLSTLETIRSEITNKPSLFERLGGFEALEKVLPKFQDKLNANPIMAPYFAKVDAQKLKEGRKHYFAAIFGGPRSYSGRSMSESHSSVKLDDKSFNLFLKLFYQTFIECGIKEDLVYEAMEVVNLTRDKVLNRKSIFERLGGKDALSAIVQKFFENLKSDNVVGPFYAKFDAQRVIKGYTNYFTYLFGGMNEHEGQPLRVIHRSFNLTDVHYNVFISVFSQTLESFKVDTEMIKEIQMMLENRRNEILQRRSLWTRLGGEEFMDKALRKFIDRIMNDATLKPMHQNVDLAKYHDSHKDFFAQAFGGYPFYSGRSMSEAHGPLKLKDEHFDVFVKLFRDTLTEMGAKEEMVSEAIQIMELQRNQVLNKTSLYERLGGEKAMETLIEKLNHQLMADPVLGPKHQGVDMEKLHLHRKQFFTQLFGNLHVYQGKDLRSAHSDLHLNDEHFNLFLKHFKSAMEELKFKEDLSKDIIIHIETMRREILNQPSLLEKLGGKAGIEQFVGKLNTTISKDAKMANFFEKVDMKKYNEDQLHFFLSLLGAESMTQQKKTVETFHEPIPLSDDHFKVFVEHTNETLKQMNIDKKIIDEVVNVFQVRRNEVLGQ